MKKLEDISTNLIEEEDIVLTALEKLDASVVKVLYVADKNRCLRATLTDGDIRRALISGCSIDTKVSEVAFYRPKIAHNDDESLLKNICVDNAISSVPVVDENGIIVSIYYLEMLHEIRSGYKIDVPVVIMAGGRGTRLYPYTKILPKPLIPIEGIPIAQRIIERFISAGCSDFYMILNYRKNMIKSYFSETEVQDKITFVDEEIPLGTGGGVKLLAGKIDKTFILTNCDILIMEDIQKIIEHHSIQENDVTMVCSLKNYEIPYGVVNFSEGGTVSSFEEKPKMSFFTNTGYYIVNPVIMNYIKNSENIGMPDILERMIKDGKKVGVYPISEKSWLDMGQFDSMEAMERRLREIINE